MKEILRSSFDLQKIMKKRLVEIEDLDERKKVRELMEMLFTNMNSENEKCYTELENRMETEYNDRNKRAVVYSGLVDKHQYSKSNTDMHPLFEEDLLDRPITTESVLAAIQENKTWKMGTFFLEADYHIVQQLAKQNRLFSAIIHTQNESYKATVQVKIDNKYRERVKELYFIFLQNGIPWRTLCIPYLHKMFAYYITDTDLPWYEQIEAVEIKFGEYEKWIRRDRIPVWNIETIGMMSDVQPSNNPQSKEYHHVINERRLQPDSKYLLADRNESIIRCYGVHELHIVSTEPMERKWELYRLGTKVDTVSEYEIFSNGLKKTCIYPVRTAGGVIRLLHALGYEERFSVENVEIKENRNEEEQVYSMNEIWDDAVCLRKDRPVLSVKLKSKVNDYLQTDILSYLISEVENQYPEYRCMAELV